MNKAEEYAWRWGELEKLQEHYSDFRDFYADASEALLGFEPTWMQYDIADYVANGPIWSMVSRISSMNFSRVTSPSTRCTL